MVSPSKFTFNDMYKFTLSALRATPELVARIFLALKTALFVYLCATLLGDIGLFAFLIYDNIETLVFLFVSGFTKTVSPFLTLFYSENDYPSVEFITKLSLKHILFLLVCCVVFSLFSRRYCWIYLMLSVFNSSLLLPL